MDQPSCEGNVAAIDVTSVEYHQGLTPEDPLPAALEKTCV